MRKFTVEEILERVTTCEREANRILATYGDGDAQVAQMNIWKSEGWKFDDAKKEWFKLIPVPQVCVDGSAINRKFVPVDEDEKSELEDALIALFDKVRDQVDYVETACMLSAGYQYKTRPNFKVASKGRASTEAKVEAAQKDALGFANALVTDPALAAEYAKATDKMAFMKTWLSK